jgi:hypothetical protein
VAALALAGAALLGGAAPQTSHNADERPRHDFRADINGQLEAPGIVTDRAGKVLRRFTVHMTGRWNGDEGVLEEDFRYSDGSTERRVWHLTRGGDGRYTGRAADVVGTAQGVESGNALNWRYTLRIPVDGRVFDVDLDDWMYLVDEQVMLNRATMSKFGIRVGEVLLAFRRR